MTWWRGSLMAASFCFLFLTASASLAVDNGTVDRFLRLSERFQSQLPGSQVQRLPVGAKRDRAVCILSRFEDRFGNNGVRALMNLMNVLSTGAEFDDPTIVAFNEQFGSEYDRAERQCTRAASG